MSVCRLLLLTVNACYDCPLKVKECRNLCDEFGLIRESLSGKYGQDVSPVVVSMTVSQPGDIKNAIHLHMNALWPSKID